jgi:carboxylate-amine ligase
MSVPEPTFTLGIEEEYLLVDRTSRDLVREAPPDLMAECEAALPRQVSPEFLQCQIEVGTRVCDGVAMARADLARLRATVAAIAAKYGLAPIAASTHPFANWTEQQHTRRERYDTLANDMRDVVQRMVICGMHVHVAVEHEDLRIDLFNQLPYFLPHLLALTTSSPFWRGRRTGLKSYRLAVFDEMPRTGLPEAFGSFGEYERTVSALVDAGLIEDGTKIWWDLRPSARFPTIEMRVADVCTYLDDAIAVAALFVCLTRMLYRLRRNNQRWRSYSRFLIDENRWRAQRYGTEQGLVDFGRGEVVAYADLLEEVIELVREDADHLGCMAEVEHARVILERGTSADRQLRRYDEAVAAGATSEDALKAVVDGLIEETLAGVAAAD